MTRLSSLALALTFAAVGIASPAAAQNMARSGAKAAGHHIKGPLYDVVPPGAPNGFSDDPSRTGGGSIGYNQMIYNW